MTMDEGQSRLPITGEYPKEGDQQPTQDMPPHEGFNLAWADAVRQAEEQWHNKGEPPVQIPVTVKYVARVDIKNPGNIGQYKVIITP